LFGPLALAAAHWPPLLRSEIFNIKNSFLYNNNTFVFVAANSSSGELSSEASFFFVALTTGFGCCALITFVAGLIIYYLNKNLIFMKPSSLLLSTLHRLNYPLMMKQPFSLLLGPVALAAAHWPPLLQSWSKNY
jgi:hypothetical protein